MLTFVSFNVLELPANPPPILNPFPGSGLASRTEMTSNVLVGTYCGSVGEGVEVGLPA